MKNNKIKELAELGQSIWFDYIRRGIIKNGELLKMIEEDGLRGITSNPTIFEKAVGESNDYDENLKSLFLQHNSINQHKSINEIYEIITTEDIRMACDLFLPTYEQTGGKDGFVSIEVSPKLAYDTERTVAEAKRLFLLINRPNVMIKIPATSEGLPAITRAISEEINVNVTLIFSVDRYVQVADAYIKGLEELQAQGKPLNKIASVASFFVSRIDTLVDKQLNEKIRLLTYPLQKESLRKLEGKAAIASSKMLYQKFKDIFQSPRFQSLQRKGAKVQRPLWGSTGTKNPAYSDVLYVNELIGSDTVNTVPPHTWSAFLDHGASALTLEANLEDAHTTLTKIGEAGISLLTITEQLEKEGVKAFSDSFDLLLGTLAAKRLIFERKIVNRAVFSFLGTGENHESTFNNTLDALKKEQASYKIWNKDAAFWKKEAEQQKIIKNSLGWLTITNFMQNEIPNLKSFVNEVKNNGTTHVVLLGMGGSSLAGMVLNSLFSKKAGYPELIILDSTHPQAIRDVEKNINLTSTLFIVSSKSGTTAEVLYNYAYFKEKVKEFAGDNYGQYFSAITTPGTPLEETAKKERFKKVFLNPTDIGGRYSALSYFGMVPGALTGMELEEFFQRADMMKDSTASCIPIHENPGIRLGTAIGKLAQTGLNKLTIVADKELYTFALWLEQLLAESTGKEGKGIIPIIKTELLPLETYSYDRTFVYLTLEGKETENKSEAEIKNKLINIQNAGHPVIVITIPDKLDIGGEFYRWEFAVSVTGHILGINPFDQPDVEASKEKTRIILSQWQKDNLSQFMKPISKDNGIIFYTIKNDKILNTILDAEKLKDKNSTDMLKDFLSRVKNGDYLAILAYLEPSSFYQEQLHTICKLITSGWKIPVTFGFGPRFLHSTGQLHKGGENTGHFLQITSNITNDCLIPNERTISKQPVTFGDLLLAQAMGDMEVLLERKRHILGVHLELEPVSGIRRLADLLSSITSTLAQPHL